MPSNLVVKHFNIFKYSTPCLCSCGISLLANRDIGDATFKSDFRLSRNPLKGQVGDEINVLMAGLCLEFEKVAGDSHYFFCFGKNWVYFL
ncbi:hypothetical protein BSPWISOXPB_10187 [uncultured Gammaproteobacteria bacterium]|nr:hypothetical protein BSPWISOXPB_10187 [uncultured Gammaproteobacteria bacterium]